MVLFQVFYRKTEQVAQEQLQKMQQAILKSKGSGMAGEQIMKQDIEVVVWPDWYVAHLKGVNMILDENNVWFVKVDDADALKLLTWFYDQFRPWAVGLGGDRGDFAKRTLAHAIDDCGWMSGMESF